MAKKTIKKEETSPAVARVTAKSRYGMMSSKRDPFMRRAEQCAKLTIPYVHPAQGDSAYTQMNTPWQSVGSFGSSVHCSKLLLSLFPPNAPFSREIPDPFELKKAKAAGQIDDNGIQQLEQALSEVEKAEQVEFESMLMRPKMNQLIELQIITGNGIVLSLPEPDADVKVFDLRDYVIKRDTAGNLLVTIIKEVVSKNALDPQLAALIPTDITSSNESDTERDGEKEVEIYTVVELKNDGKTRRWEVWQEIEAVEIPGSRGFYPYETCPVIAPRMIAKKGEDYGRSYVERYIGDLIAVDSLMAAITQASACAARIIYLVKPNSVTATNIGKINSTRNGGYVIGNAEDISPIQMNKGNDMEVTRQTCEDAIKRLEYAFLMTQAIQRNAERVTAEEIRLMAQELDATLGGVYSLLAGELQLSVATLIKTRLIKAGKMIDLPKGSVRTVIVTGLSSIGRGNELNKITQFVQFANGIGAGARIKQAPVLMKVGNELTLDTEPFIKTDQEMQQEAAAGQQGELMKAATPNAVKGIMDNLNNPQAQTPLG